MNEKIRVRFAPSPTGHLHIGGVRTALYNWVFAKQQKGDFILRIEDTDLIRSKKTYIRSILDSLDWLGFSPFDGTYYQSERLDIYMKYAEELIKKGNAYYCFCSKEDIETEKKECKDRSFKYSGKCRGNYDKQSGQFSIRIKSVNKEYILNDLIRGEVRTNSEEFDDFIIIKSDGTPTYSFCCVVDDHLLEITHVIRGEDHITNTFRQMIIFDLFGWSSPKYGHIPLILGPDSKRLSKRYGATSLIEYRENGFIREAMINYLSLLGWSPGNDVEIFDIDFLIKNFSLERISKNSAQFDLQKLIWMNGEYLFNMPPDKKTGLLTEYIERFVKIKTDPDILKKAVAILGKRGKTLKEIWEYISFIFFPPDHYEKVDLSYSEELIELLADIEFNIAELELKLKDFCKEKGLGLKELAYYIRYAITGRNVSPGIFESLEIIGKEESIKRMKRYEQWKGK